jgi:hypothetical protein
MSIHRIFLKASIPCTYHYPTGPVERSHSEEFFLYALPPKKLSSFLSLTSIEERLAFYKSCIPDMFSFVFVPNEEDRLSAQMYSYDWPTLSYEPDPEGSFKKIDPSESLHACNHIEILDTWLGNHKNWSIELIYQSQENIPFTEH